MRACLAGQYGSLKDVGDLAVELPRGARIWVHLGGPAAVTGETEMLMSVEHALNGIIWQNGGGKGPEPKPREYPESVAEMEKQAAKVTSKAERWRERHQPQETTE